MSACEFFHGGAVPPPAGSGVFCEDPACFRKRPHWVREYGCRWSNVAIDNKDGTCTRFRDDRGNPLPEPVTE